MGNTYDNDVTPIPDKIEEIEPESETSKATPKTTAKK